MKVKEGRREPRYRGKLPVELESGKAVTRDFSGSGVFFETDRSFSLGQPIEFTLVLEHIDPERPVRLKCRGEIVRVEESGQKIGAAATISSYTFEEIQPKRFSKIFNLKHSLGMQANEAGKINR